MEPSANCSGITCEQNKTGKTIRGMCRHHYGKWVRASHAAGEPPIRTKAVGCSVEGCDVELIQGRGWCSKHYYRWKQHGDPLWEPAGPTLGCAAGDCDRDHYSLGYCVMHYTRFRTHGDPEANPRVPADDECDAPDCAKPPTEGRYCSVHRARLTRLGAFDLPERAGRYKTENGYILVKADGHPLANSKGWAFEHRLVLFAKIGPGPHECHWCGLSVYWERSYGDKCPDALVTDHVDEDKENNDPGNVVQSCPRCNLARSSRWVKRQRREAQAI